MIDFGNFYFLIVKNYFLYWFEMLFVQIVNWQCEQQYGLFKQWLNVVEFLFEIKLYCFDLLYSVMVESEELLSVG